MISISIISRRKASGRGIPELSGIPASLECLRKIDPLIDPFNISFLKKNQNNEIIRRNHRKENAII